MNQEFNVTPTPTPVEQPQVTQTIQPTELTTVKLEEPKKNNGPLIAIIVVLLIVIAALVVYILLGNKDTKEETTTTTTTTTVVSQQDKDTIGTETFNIEGSNSKLKVVYKYDKTSEMILIDETRDESYEYHVYLEMYLNDKLVTEERYYIDYYDEEPKNYTTMEDALLVTKDDISLIKTDKEYVLVHIYVGSPTYVPGRALLVLNENSKTVENIDLSVTEYELSDDTISSKFNGNKYYIENNQIHYLEYEDSDVVKEVVCEIKNDKKTIVKTNMLDLDGIMNEE